MKTKLLVSIISGSFLVVATIITVVANNNSNKERLNTTVQINPKIDKSTNIDDVENLTINQYLSSFTTLWSPSSRSKSDSLAA